MGKWLLGLLVICLLFSGCETIQELSPKTKTGAGIGAVAGGILGALIDSNKPWRGAIIGAAAGAAAGGLIGYKLDKPHTASIVNDAAAEAAKQNATVKFERITEAGVKEEIVATPVSTKDNYRTVNVKYYQNGKLITEETKEIKI
ncbi:MAG: YMGG-like glycine zipper-containing protein [Candidatus Omnitrophica bacterium]|nr:YMGG-like glycine zipper-containing protein [Candidatus Omnitrophota bacterium]